MKATGMEIESIRLEDMLPRVFEYENIPASEIWRRDVTLRRGGRYLVEAASGTGKSSLCAYIYGLRRDYLGRLLFNGSTDARTLSPDQWQALRRTQLALLPQELALFPELTALENIRLKNSLTGAMTSGAILSAMEELGIGARANHPVGCLSIGQQQRVALIRALCQPFSFIFLDEPVSHLDEANNRAAAAMIEREAARYGAAIVTTSVGNPLLLSGCSTLRL